MNQPDGRTAIDVGIIVHDMDVSLGFYRDLLGLPVAAEGRTSLIGQGRMVSLRYGTGLIKLVELEARPTERTSRGIPAALGIRYITLIVADIAAVLQALETGGVAVSLPVSRLGNGALIAMVEDPDGNTVEFVQEP